MKPTSMILIFILIAGTHTALGQKRKIFDPNGGEFQISGEKPAGFEGFERMYLQTLSSNERRIAPRGGVEFGRMEYAMRNIVFDGRYWSFDTVSIGGVHYKFYGRFRKLKFDEHGAIIGDRALQGRFIKFVRGKSSVKAELIFSFVYYSD